MLNDYNEEWHMALNVIEADCVQEHQIRIEGLLKRNQIVKELFNNK